jgi:outer membrane receptor for ferrienterochelin and colicins
MTQVLEQTNEPGYGATGQFINSGHYQALGFQLESEKRWDSGRLIKASYTFSHVTNENEGDVRSVGSPQNIFKIHYAEPLFNDFAKLGVENIYIGQRRTSQDSIADAYNLVNLNLTSDKILPGLDVSFGVYNIFGTHYQMLGGTGPADITQKTIPMNGREFRLKLQLTF